RGAWRSTSRCCGADGSWKPDPPRSSSSPRTSSCGSSSPGSPRGHWAWSDRLSGARALGALAGAAVRRPLLVGALALVLGAAGAGLAVGLTPSTAVSTFVEGSSPTYRPPQSFSRRFGSEPIEIVVKGNLQR